MFSYKGRLSRKNFFWGSVLPLVIMLPIIIVMVSYFTAVQAQNRAQADQAMQQLDARMQQINAITNTSTDVTASTSTQTP